MPKPLQIKLESLNTTIEAIAYGDANKPMILALHGWLDNTGSFATLAPELKDYYVICIDFPGHGLSQLPDNTGDFSMHLYMDVIAEIIPLLTEQPLILMGHSMGGAVASIYAAQNPDKVTKLILIDVLGPPSSDTTTANTSTATNATKMRAAALQASTKTYQNLDTMVAIRMRANHLTYEQAKAMTARGAVKTNEGYQWRYDPKVASSDTFYFTENEVLTLLAKINCPVLIIAGKEGIFKGRDHYQQRLNTLENHQLEILEGRHHIHLEKTEQSFQLINHFLKIK